MKSNPFNICPTCIHRETCVLTQQKNQVWSCSEYDEDIFEANKSSSPSVKTEVQNKMATA